MSQPRHIYASTRRRRRPVWPAAVVVAAVLGALAALVDEVVRRIG